jgi:hypothetical protein
MFYVFWNFFFGFTNKAISSKIEALPNDQTEVLDGSRHIDHVYSKNRGSGSPKNKMHIYGWVLGFIN